MFSFWQKDVYSQYDAVIVGAGICGLSAACQLLERAPGLKVAVAEQFPAPGGASVRNAGFACFGSLTELLADKQSMNSEDWLGLVAERNNGINALRQEFSDAEIDFEPCGGYELIFGANYPALNQLEVVNRALFPVFEQTVFTVQNNRIETFGFPKDHVKALIFNPLEGALHPGKLVRALWRRAASLGADVFFGRKINSIERDADGWRLKSSNPAVPDLRAPNVAFCANGYDAMMERELGAKPGRGQVLLTKPIENLPFRGTFHFEEGYYYFRNLGDRLLFGGGRNLDFEAESANEHALTDLVQDQLEKYLREIILPDRDFEIDTRWAGIMAFREEGRPEVREPEPGLFVAGGFSGMGVALGWPLGVKLARRMAG